MSLSLGTLLYGRPALNQCVSINCAHDTHYAVLAHAGPATLHPVGPRRLVSNIAVGHWDHDTSDVAGAPPPSSACLPLAARTVRRACVVVASLYTMETRNYAALLAFRTDLRRCISIESSKSMPASCLRLPQITRTISMHNFCFASSSSPTFTLTLP